MEKNSQPQAINAEKLLRHWLDAIKFRFTTAISGTERNFASFDVGPGVRRQSKLYVTYRNCYKTAIQKFPVRRMYDLNLKAGMKKRRDFMKSRTIGSSDHAIYTGAKRCENVVLGPLTDATSHIGQLTMLRRLAGIPVSDINYSQAK